MAYKVKNIYKYLLLLISIVLVCTCAHPLFSLDEQYTMSLVSHSYLHLIDINTLDVHPPTYYLLLKLFLNISTFWTNSIFVKILFARIFSFVFFILMFVLLHKLIKLCDIQISWIIQISLYLMLFTISMNSVNIRMYSFYSLFIVATYYQLILYDTKQGQTSNLILALIFAIITSYIDYFATVCVGMFMLIFCIKDYFIKKYKKVTYLLLSGIFLLIFNYPMILLLCKQVNNRKHFPLGNNITIFGCIRNVIFSFTQTNNRMVTYIIFIIFIFIILWSFMNIKKELFNKILAISLVNYILSITFANIICLHFNVFETKLLYPQYAIYSFLIINILIIMMKKGHLNKFCKIACRLICLLIIVIALYHIKLNYQQYTYPFISFVKTIDKSNNIKNVNLNYDRIPKRDNKPLYITQYSTFLKYKNKKLIVSHCTPYMISSKVVNGKNKLLRLNFNNLKFK